MCFALKKNVTSNVNVWLYVTVVCSLKMARSCGYLLCSATYRIYEEYRQTCKCG